MSIINLEELESLTVKLYGPKQDLQLLEYATMLKDRFVSEIKFEELFEKLINTNNQNCQFWIFDLLIAIVNDQYKNFTNDQKAKFRELLIYVLENYTQKIFSVTFIETKFCVLFINWIKHDYPENWSTFFKDLIALIFNTNDENLKLFKVTFLIDLMSTFDEELVKFRHTYTDYCLARSTKIKDFMREEAVGEIIFVINQLMQNEKHFPKKLIKNSIRVIAQLVDWNNLNLFNDSVTMITGSLINQLEYQPECLEVFNSVINKGMDPNQKLEVIKYLNVNQFIEGILKNTNNLNENSLFQICEIVSNIGNFTIECFELIKGLTKGEMGSNMNQDQQRELFNYVCELTNYCLYHSITIINYSLKVDVKLALQLCEFISNLTSYLKNNEYIAEVLVELLRTLINNIENLLIIPNDYDIQSSLLLGREDDEFFNFRKEFTTLYHNFFQVNPLKLFLITSLNNRLDTLAEGKGNLSIYEIELSLHLTNSLQNAVSNADLQNLTVSEQFNKIIYHLFNIPFTNVNSDFILILYYETVYRYIQYIINNDNILIYVTKLYLSKKGIMHENSIVGTKICICFDKFVDKVKTQLGKMEIIYDISDTLKNFIQFLCVENKNFVLLCEYNIMFKTLCQTILQKNFNEERRQVAFKEVLSIFDIMFLNFGLDAEKFVEISKCITNFIKCIGFELNPNTKIIFVDYFNNFIKEVYLKLGKSVKVDYAMITILQRLVTILGKDSIQYLEYFIESQIKFPEAEVFEDACKLLHNATQILKKESKSLVVNCFFYFFETLKNIKLPDTNISEIDKNILSIYSSFAKLIANVTTDIIEVLFESGGMKNVDVGELINFLIYISYNVIDPNTRRSVIKSLKAIVIYLIKVLTGGNIDDNYSQSFLNYLQFILSGTFRVYGRLNVTDPIDFNVSEFV